MSWMCACVSDLLQFLCVLVLKLSCKKKHVPGNTWTKMSISAWKISLEQYIIIFVIKISFILYTSAIRSGRGWLVGRAAWIEKYKEYTQTLVCKHFWKTSIIWIHWKTLVALATEVWKREEGMWYVLAAIETIIGIWFKKDWRENTVRNCWSHMGGQ
jgi:hypothetical protein